ncbi:Frag1/DRAM/Sfk1 family-domain-containing protein [Collybia nuda]|uniref:Frag1/DRAM/Sfk1 family-domain-containing protein n=1 Tax=Collybia nuda TaxID=64659 RepID=A0A9P5YDG4_9AGAR|nr:Frag1/DRAM/Sfk1 family-domain-containing protein [Collybia nuda]
MSKAPNIQPGSRRNKQPFVLHASLIGRAHTYLASAAFLVALCVGSWCHYKKIVKNGVAGYPEEWFPSVSATIGDWYPERNLFQILIALTSGPRLALVALQYYLQKSHASSLPGLVFVFGLIRTLSCGGWVYITSNDDHDVHDIFMITYMVCNIPWMLGGISCTPTEQASVRRKRTFVATAFFAAIIPLIYFFIQHKVHRVPGAYTNYAFFEWGLIFFDVLYDSFAEQEFREVDLHVVLGPSISNVDKIIIKAQPLSVNSVSANSEKTPGVAQSQVTANGQQPVLHKNLSSSGFRPAASFVSDVYLSYIFWSVFTSLIPTLFYFSVWELGIAGQELALLSTLSPVFLGIAPLLAWTRTRGGLTTLHLLSFTGLAAYALEEPLHRLLVVTPATGAVVMRQVVEWAGVEAVDVGYQGVLMGLGLLVSSLSKHVNHSNNPVWPFVNGKSMGYNKTGLTLGFLAVCEFYTRPTAPFKGKAEKSTLKRVLPSSEGWLSAAIPLGSLIFCLHNMLADSSTIIAWSWTGYQNSLPKGPVPHLHGSLTLIAQCIGLLLPVILSTNTSDSSLPTPAAGLLAHPLWLLCGTVSSFIMYKYRDWTGYTGGLGVAVFLMSIIPLVLQRAAATQKVGRTYFVAFLVYCLLNLASIFTVAYAFVPGGVYLRERTDCVVFAQVACLALAFRWPQLNHNGASYSISAPSARFSKSLLSIISVLSVLGTLYRWPSAPRPFVPGPRILNAGIWTLHFGIDNEGRDSQRGVKTVIEDMKLDIVGFLETDLHRTAFGHRDLTRVAAEELGYNVDIGPGPNSHTWGAVLLSKFPIINSTHHLLPSPGGELAPAIEAVLDVYGTEITVVVAHNGQEEDPLDRELQSRELARIMAAAYPRPAIFLGYVVTKPQEERPAPYKFLIEDGLMHDIDWDDQDRWCEYILYRGVYRTSYARISRGIITDTELQVGQFMLPKHGYNVTDDSDSARYQRAFKEEMPKDLWFPNEYFGNKEQGGVNGHFYHVFNTPLYYKLPKDAVL